jgi:hypothetical protein
LPNQLAGQRLCCSRHNCTCAVVAVHRVQILIMRCIPQAQQAVKLSASLGSERCPRWDRPHESLARCRTAC